MVESESRDGHTIATLLEAEIDGFEDPPFDRLTFEWGGSDETSEASGGGDTGPDCHIRQGAEPLARGTIQPDRVLLEFGSRQAGVAEAAAAAELRVRPRATHPPATLVFVERGADVKRVIDVLRECHPVQ